MGIDQFQMGKMQSRHWHRVDFDLSESGVTALTTAELIDRVRIEQSVLLVPGDMLGVGRAIRFGYGSDIEHTLEGLARVDEVLIDVVR